MKGVGSFGFGPLGLVSLRSGGQGSGFIGPQKERVPLKGSIRVL